LPICWPAQQVVARRCGGCRRRDSAPARTRTGASPAAGTGGATSVMRQRTERRLIVEADHSRQNR
jgi:hypothetical protein